MINILLVDDCKLSHKITSAYIKYILKTDFTITSCYSGMEMKEIIKISYFDYIFLDVKMPIMSGLDCFDLLKLIDYSTNVYFLTALDENYNIPGEVLYKPISLQELINIFTS